MFTGGAHGTHAALPPRGLRGRTDRRARRSSPRPTPPPWSSPAGAREVRRSITWCSSASSAPARARHRHPRRSGDARGLQQPVHVDRRADGPAAREHRLLGEHQGAARFLLRAVRRRGQPDRQRAAHAGASRLDGRVDQDRDPRERRAHEAGRRLCAQRALQRRHASARRHRDHAGVRRASRQQILFYVGSRGHHADIGGITPGSMPPSSHGGGGGGRADRQLPAGRAGAPARGGDVALLASAATRRATSSRTSPTCARRSPPTRRARRSCAAWSRTSASTWCTPTCATSRTTPRRRCAASSTC